jgi:predicted Rossmann-fold nucleotide-binding protein
MVSVAEVTLAAAPARSRALVQLARAFVAMPGMVMAIIIVAAS